MRAASEAALMALVLELDGKPLSIKSCYALSEARARRYAALTDLEGVRLFPALAQGGYALTGQGYKTPAAAILLGDRHGSGADTTPVIDEMLKHKGTFKNRWTEVVQRAVPCDDW